MNIASKFWEELKQESANTKILLAAVPFDKADFKPHEKSMSLKALASHVAEINGWWKECLVQDELDFSKDMGAPKQYHSTEDIVAWHDELLVKAEQILSNTPDEAFAKPWTMRNGEIIYFTLPKEQVVRTWCL
ncbi:MAG: hypothetical protein FD183_111, partial [Chitinophagaceae bacterium]